MPLGAPGVDIEYPTDGPPIVRQLSTSTTAFVGRTVVRNGAPDGVHADRITSADEFLQKYGTPGANAGAISFAASAADFPGGAADHMGHAVAGYFSNGGLVAVIVSTSGAGTATASNLLGITTAAGTVSVRASARSPGAWGNGVRIILERSTADRVDVRIVSGAHNDGTDAERTERYTSVPGTLADLIALASEHVVFADPGGAAAPAPNTINLTDEDAAPVEVDLEDGENAAAPGGSAINDAVTALQDEDDVSLIVLPGRTWTAGGTDNAVFTQFVAHCEQMADRMVLVQLAHDTADFANTGLPFSSYLSAYYPEGHVAVPLTRDVVTRPRVGLTGHVSGVVARTDNRVGAWQSAAGLSADVRGITEFSRSISRIQHAPINDQGINVMRVVNGVKVIYGARTRDVGGIYQYMAVRRLAFLIGDSLRAAMQPVVFARNIESTWQNVKTAARGFLQSLFDQRAFQGATADEAFQVFCGLGESMTQFDIENGVLVVRARVRSAKPAEVIIVRVAQRLLGEA